MASKIDRVIIKPIHSFERLHQKYRILAEGYTSEMACEEGFSLTPLDFKVMDIAFDLKAHSGFWKPADRTTRSAVLKEYSGDLKALLSDCVTYTDKLAEDGSPTIADANNSNLNT